MKALILVGGFGRLMRPLTLTCPKPLIDFANKPIILHQIEALKAVGVDEIILSMNYKPEDLQMMLDFAKEYETKLGIKITCLQETEFSQESESLGTAGSLALARDILVDGSGEPFFVLNIDVICEFPLKEMISFHSSHRGEASIMVTKVDEPSKYRVVVMEETTGLVKSFVEKPEESVGNMIFAGIYLLNPSILDCIEVKPTSLEKEILPQIAEAEKLYAVLLPGFWMDIGIPGGYMTSLKLYLDSLREKSPYKLATGPNIIGNVLVDESAEIGENCVIGPDVVIGPDCMVESRVSLSSCTVMRGVHVGAEAHVAESIIGWESRIGELSRLENMSVLGKDVHIGDKIYCNGGVVLPNVEINSNVMKPEILM